MSERCEAPRHHKNCNGRGETVDHHTPKCIAKIFGWKRKQINAPENLQYLSKPCHREKDRSTPKRKLLLQGQLKGKETTLEEYLDLIR